MADDWFSSLYLDVEYANHVAHNEFMQQLIARINVAGGRTFLPNPRDHVNDPVIRSIAVKVLAKQKEKEQALLCVSQIREALKPDYIEPVACNMFIIQWIHDMIVLLGIEPWKEHRELEFKFLA